MKHEYRLYGWHLSYFTGKALCYLRYKQVDHELKPVDFFTLMHTIKKRTGAAVMPVLRTDDGKWIQDTSEIIDFIESRHADNPVIPESPVQQFASLLLEAWGDEWWVPIAMHTRWTYPENYALFEREAGEALAPWAPRFIQNRLAAKPASMLRSMLPLVGIVPEQLAVMDGWTDQMLDSLDSHFSKHPFLLGNRPSLGDFGLVGTMYGHLGRDPWPKRELIEPREHLHGWLERMKAPAAHSTNELIAADQIPESLNHVFHSIFKEFLPLVNHIGQLANTHASQHGLGKRLPRRLGYAETTMNGKPFRRGALPYMIWMVQRAFDCFAAMNAMEQQQVRNWLASHQAEHILNMNLPRVERDALSVKVTALAKHNRKLAA